MCQHLKTVTKMHPTVIQVRCLGCGHVSQTERKDVPPIKLPNIPKIKTRSKGFSMTGAQQKRIMALKGTTSIRGAANLLGINRLTVRKYWRCM